jgi:O-antigen/teichoic acid export membrane protein
LGVIFGDKFITGYSISFWLLIFAPLSAIASVGSALVYGLGRARFVALSSLLGAIAAPLVYFLVIPAYGSIGAAIARGIMQAVLIATGSLYITFYLHYPFPLRSYMFCMIAAGVTAAISQMIFPQQEFMYIVIKGVLVLGAYTLLTINKFVFTAQERMNVSSMIKSIYS